MENIVGITFFAVVCIAIVAIVIEGGAIDAVVAAIALLFANISGAIA